MTYLYNPVAIRERVIASLKQQFIMLRSIQSRHGDSAVVALTDGNTVHKMLLDEQTYVVEQTEEVHASQHHSDLVDKFVKGICHTLSSQPVLNGVIAFAWREMAAQTSVHDGVTTELYCMTYGIVRTDYYHLIGADR